ncbi:MAG: DUF481 domain-containing protein [Cytophagales bacterium]|nr:DUF481 domain-containing protein [Cytophagales bacterium]
MTKYFFLLIFTVISQSYAQVRDSVRTDTARAAGTNAVIGQPDTTRPKQTPPAVPYWTYSLGIDGMFNSGNVNRRLLTVRGTVSHETPNSIWGFFSSPRFQYGTNNEILQERELFVDFNNTWFKARHDVYGLFFGAYEQSNLRQINHRLNVGVGAGWQIVGGRRVPSSRFQLSLSNALLREFTDFISIPDRDVYRLSTRLKVRYEIVKEKLTFQNTTFYQPALDQRNLRWNTISQLVFKLSKQLSLTATLDQSYESVNVQGVRSNQLNATLGLSYAGSR